MEPNKDIHNTAGSDSNIEDDGYWTEIIKPKANLLDIRLGEVWNYRDLLVLFVKRDFVARYKQTVLGPLWNIIQPLLTTAISVLLYNKVAGIATPGVDPILFQMSGIVVWAYFSSCLTGTSTTFVGNAGIFGKVYFPRLISPLSVVVSNIVQFGIQFCLLVATIIFIAVKSNLPQYFGVSWLLVPIIIFLLAGIGFGLGIIISSVTTKYRDFSVLLGFGVQLLMFASAVNIPLLKYYEKLEGQPVLFALIKWNPLAILVESFRNAVLGGPIQWGMLAYCFVFMIVCLFFGALVFNKVEKSFMDTV